MTDNSSTPKDAQDQQIKISDGVLVMEKELKSDSCHKDLITGIQNLSDLEFLTCGVEQALKVWDKSLQSCDYTIETHAPLHTMAITGERGDIMIASQGEGNLIVFGLTNKNQEDIVEGAHQETVIQIVSLQKLKNKYFATRCIGGNVNIWSSTYHPDRLFTIEHVDRDEASLVNDGTLNMTKDPNQTGQNQTMQMGPISCERDRMIELRYKLLNQSSSTVLCFSNYNECLVLIAIVDLKTRKKNIIKTFKNQRYPTFLYQIDETNLLVGTEGGIIEHWSIDQEQLLKTYQAHQNTDEGISSIIELKSHSYLMWGSVQDRERCKLIATASFGSPEFRIWVLDSQLILNPHIRIETSLTGIKYLLESSETQLVAVDTFKTLKFYDFIDKVKKEEEEKRQAEEEKMHQGMKEMFDNYDIDKSGKITIEEFKLFLKDYYIKYGYEYLVDNEEYMKVVFDYYDTNHTGFISKYEMKPLVKILMDSGFLKNE